MGKDLPHASSTVQNFGTRTSHLLQLTCVSEHQVLRSSPWKRRQCTWKPYRSPSGLDMLPTVSSYLRTIGSLSSGNTPDFTHQLQRPGFLHHWTLGGPFNRIKFSGFPDPGIPCHRSSSVLSLASISLRLRIQANPCAGPASFFPLIEVIDAPCLVPPSGNFCVDKAFAFFQHEAMILPSLILPDI